MTACAHHFIDADGLACTRDDGHDYGHVYESRWAADAERDEE